MQTLVFLTTLIISCFLIELEIRVNDGFEDRAQRVIDELSNAVKNHGTEKITERKKCSSVCNTHAPTANNPILLLSLLVESSFLVTVSLTQFSKSRNRIDSLHYATALILTLDL
ncbi:unnamed protein product [Caenorhabditis nigoni]